MLQNHSQQGKQNASQTTYAFTVIFVAIDWLLQQRFLPLNCQS